MYPIFDVDVPERMASMNAKEFGFSTFIASVGTILCSCLGGWDAALKVLVVLMVIDYVTGFLGAIKNKQVNSEIMFWEESERVLSLLLWL